MLQILKTVATPVLGLNPRHKTKAGIVRFEFFTVNFDSTKLRLITRHLGIVYSLYNIGPYLFVVP